MTAADDRPDAAVEEEFTIMNEFTAVRVRKVRTGNGERVELHSLRLGHSVRLDALAAECLTWQTPLEIGRALETPLGPEKAVSPTATEPADAV